MLVNKVLILVGEKVKLSFQRQFIYYEIRFARSILVTVILAELLNFLYRANFQSKVIRFVP